MSDRDENVLSDLRKYILEHPDGDFSGVLGRDERFDIFYHLAETRRSLFNWYSFRPGASLLEVGGECGALTDLFCEKCASVVTLTDTREEADLIVLRHQARKNLRVQTGISDWARFAGEFDYIVLVGTLEYLCGGNRGTAAYSSVLREIASHLKPDGTLLLAVDNRYGLRYFCGERDPISNQPFRGLNRYPGGSKGYLFSRQELIQIMAGLPSMRYKFYYPLPDYRFPQLIYTDAFLPEETVKERLQAYSRDPSTLVMDELRLYDDIAANNVFPFFANSFLLECSRTGRFDPVNYAALSTDRGPAHSFATMICEGGSVRKTALYPEGAASLDRLVRNMDELARRGVGTVPHLRSENEAVMPAISAPTLSQALKDALRNAPERFLGLFKLLYQDILKSSAWTDLASSECYAENPDPRVWGPVLEKAYIDMIPINCFIQNGQLLFFDQEFVRENYPASYVMFRAIKYTYFFMPFAESIVPCQVLKEKYRLTQLWTYYADVEKEFVAENRNYSVYGHFTSWCGLRAKRIKENTARLAGEQEALCATTDFCRRNGGTAAL